MRTEKEIVDFLNSLGNNRGEVYETLKKKGIKGSKISPGSCPIARVLIDELDDGTYSVSPFDISHFNGGSDVQWIRANIPFAVADFIRSFDRSEYPDMIE